MPKASRTEAALSPKGRGADSGGESAAVMPKASRAARRLSAEPVPTSKSRESEAAIIINYYYCCPVKLLSYVANKSYSHTPKDV